MSDVETTELDDVVDTPVDESTVIDEKIARTLRRENAARRIENRELKERLAQRDADLEAEHARINALMAQAEETSSALEKERVARQQELERLKAANEAAIARLPEKVQKVVPTKYDPFELRDWLDAAAPELTNFAAVQTDGQQGRLIGPVKHGADQGDHDADGTPGGTGGEADSRADDDQN